MIDPPSAASGRAFTHLVQQASRTLTRIHDHALKPLGLTSGQAFLLARIACGDLPGIGRLADDLVMDRTTVTALLGPLMRHGLAEITPAIGDRRVRRVGITRRGLLVSRAATEEIARIQGEIAESLPFDPAELEPALQALASLPPRGGLSISPPQ